MNNSPVSQGNGSKIRRGLVLEGGGAKGAWQFGALQALEDAGIKFDYVAGTSVGALNGALWAAGRLDLGKELWTSLSLSKVFKLRLHHSPMFVIGVFARIFYAYVKGFISPSAAPLSIRIVLRGLMSVPAIVATIYLLLMLIKLFSAAMNNGRLWLIPILAIVIAVPVAGLVISRKEEGRQQYFLYTSYLALIVLVVHLFFSVVGVTDINLKDGPALGVLVVETALDMPLFLWVLAVIPFVIFCIAKVLRQLNTSIFSVGPLEVVIKNLLASKFKMPMFATVAREIHKYFDPDDLKYRHSSILNKYFDPDDRHSSKTNISTPIPRSTITPSYLRVDRLTDENALTTLLATSALPLGITPRCKGEHAVGPQELIAIREAEAEEYSKLLLSRTFKEGSDTSKVFLMDGGVVDNLPWHPFIEDVPCDEIVIVGCNPMPNWNDQETVKEMKEEWKDRARLLRMVESSLEYPVNEPVLSVDEDGIVTCLEQGTSGFEPIRIGYSKPIKNDPPIIVPRRGPNRWPNRVVVIAPKTRLGNFLTGTLNFSTKVAQERRDAGYKEASCIIKKELKPPL